MRLGKSLSKMKSLVLSQINARQFSKIGAQLNNGTPCHFDIAESPDMGSANFHAWLRFDNGDKWIVRIPQASVSLYPPELTEYIVASEYATLKFLEKTKLPAPRVYDY